MRIDMTAAPAEEQNATQVAPTPTSAIVPAQSFAPAVFTSDNDAEGEFDQSDIEKPKLVIVAKTGALSNEFTPGDMLLNKEFVIGTTKQPLEVVPVAIKKLYQNDLDFDGGEMGETVASAAQVLEKGGVVGYRPFEDKTSRHYWKPILMVVFLVKKPAGLPPDAEAYFPYEIDGAEYSIVGYYASAKSAYNGIAKPLIQAKQAKGSVRLSTYKLSTRGESTPDNKRSWIQVSLRASGPSSAVVRQFLAENAG